MEKKKITIGLQGGGTHLAFSSGVIDCLLEDGRFEIEGASGTSAGGLICATLAQGLLKNGPQGARDELKAFWDMIISEGIRLGLRPSYFDRYLYKESVSFSLYIEMLKGVFHSWLLPGDWNPYGKNTFKNVLNNFFDFEKLAHNEQFKLFITATNVLNSKLKVFSGKDLTVEAFMATACLPYLTEAIEINGEYYWDGAYIGNPSLFPLMNECSSRDILVVLVIPHKVSKLPHTFMEVRSRLQELSSTNALVREMRAINFIGSLMEENVALQKKLKKMNMHIIEDSLFFEEYDAHSRLNTDKNFLQKLHERGRLVAAKWIENNFEHVGKKSTANIQEEFI
ncbi:MAG: patatin-like phospholipase family protein [Alphaproteobacteria bacterium]|nr:patatin-like phospholipase family protein [Alphaproteobacteria bacterium]